MIDIQKDTPIEYSKQSRDYQVFSFLYSALFNQVKLFVDQIENIWTDNIDDKLLLPRSYTLNFIPKYDWDNDDLRGVTNNFRDLLRTKGTTDAIKACLEILARLHNASIQGIEVEILGPGHIRIIIGEEISDFGIIEDLLRYILPAGITYEVVKYANVNSTLPPTEILVNSRFETVEAYDNSELYIPHYSTFGTYPAGGFNEQYAITYNPSEGIPGSGETAINNRIIDKDGHYIRGDFDARFGPGMIVTAQSNAGLEIYIDGTKETRPYNGQIQTIRGYRVFANKDYFDPSLLRYVGGIHDSEASGLNVGLYQMKLDSTDFEYGTSETKYTVIVDNGYLRITGGDLIINIAGNKIVIPYDNLPHTSEVGFEVVSTAPSEGLFDPDRLAARVSGTITATNVGTYYMGLQRSDFSYRDPKVSTLTINVEDGYVQIIPRKVGVNIFGNSETIEYDGKPHVIEGYDIDFDDPLYKEDFISFTGDSEDQRARGKDVGKYDMSLPGKFRNTSDNFEVEFDIYNGFLKITPKNVTVTANDSEKTYGDDDPEFTAKVVGIVTSEDDSEHSLISYTLTRSSEDIQNVGTYSIIPEGESEQGNNTVTYIPGKFIINKAPWKIITDSERKVYDGTKIDRGIPQAIGLKYNDQVELKLSSEDSEDMIDAGTYINELGSWRFINCNSENYLFPTVSEGTLVIEKRPATIICE